jgi:hypothetical protein
MAQSYPNVEHIIVSDRPDDELLDKLRSFLDESDAPDKVRSSRSMSLSEARWS